MLESFRGAIVDVVLLVAVCKMLQRQRDAFLWLFNDVLAVLAAGGV